MNQIRELDVRSRGVGRVVEEWKANQQAVRDAWRVDDMIQALVECFREASALFDHYCSTGSFPNTEVRFSYFALLLERLVAWANETESWGAAIESSGLPVAGLDELRQWIDKTRTILDEDRFATDVAFESGALNDWD